MYLCHLSGLSLPTVVYPLPKPMYCVLEASRGALQDMDQTVSNFKSYYSARSGRELRGLEQAAVLITLS